MLHMLLKLSTLFSFNFLFYLTIAYIFLVTIANSYPYMVLIWHTQSIHYAYTLLC